MRMRGRPVKDDKRHGRQSSRNMVCLQALGLAGVAGTVALTASSARWSLGSLAVILTFSGVSVLTSFETGSSKISVSGSFLGIVLAAVLLGGGPGALVGALTCAIGWFRRREAGHYLRNNLLTYAWFPLIGGLFFHAASRLAHVGSSSPGFYLLVFATFVVSLAVNFLAVAGYQCYLDGSTIAQKTREALMPVLAAELFSDLLTMAAVYVAVRLGTAGLALFGLVLVVFQYLVGKLLISQRRADELHRMATTDELTGLANRERFRARVEEQIVEAQSSKEAAFAVMLIDLDRFKEVNDTLGHHYGDELLRDLGPRLAACVGSGGLVARLGGDEFAVLTEESTDDVEVLEGVAARLMECVVEPLSLDEMTLEVGASIGISRFPADGEDPHALLRHADVAMYAAKEAHIGCKLYAPELDRHSVRRLSVIGDFRRALENDEIVVYYQPIVDVDGRHVYGAEGLVRWQHPEQGLLPPGAFIQTIEQTGLIGPLTRHVLERCIAQCAQWRQAGKDLSVAVNLSVRNLLDRNLPNDIDALLRTYGLPAEALHLEITESMLMSDPDRALATVTRLSELGARVSVDDFGTGYSSLANLRRFPIDELKIDRSFVSPMLQDESDLIIVRSTINLGHDLGLQVVAEGVEDQQTLHRLARLGCDLIQGFYISKPIPAEDFETWIQTTDSRHATLAVAV
jgi:diguanylate cyclase (GGDEF)-like protein